MIIVMLVILGLCLGSFVNALVWRLHEQAKPAGRRTSSDVELSIMKGRSMCPHCRHTLAWYDLIPVVSWLQVRGSCRYCKAPIAWQYPLVELATAAIFVLSYILWPYGFSAYGTVLFGAWLLTVVAFMALLVYDLRWMLLPNKIVFPLILFWVVVSVVLAFIEGPSYLYGAVLGALACYGIFYGLYAVSDGRWMGGGDVKLAIVLGLIVASPLKAVLIIFVASYVGVITALPTLIRQRKLSGVHTPFGPALMAAAAIVFFAGDKLVKLLISV